MHNTLRVDLTKQTTQWNRIQVASALALFFSLDSVVSILFNAIRDSYRSTSADHSGFIVQVPLCILALFMIHQTWKYGAVFDRKSLTRLRNAFIIASVPLILLFSAIVVISFNAEQTSRSELKQLFTGAAGFGFMFIGCIIVAIAIARLMKSKVDGVEVRLGDALDYASAKANVPPPEAYSIVRIDQPMGVVWILLGAIVFIFGAALGSILWDFWAEAGAEGNSSQLLQLSTLVEIGGALLVLKGRAYFVPKAEAVLAIDKRTPIVYLRSFTDEAVDTVHWTANSAFVDRSFEMKLARYFLPFGPFLAIGSPRDALPKLGALRLMRSDAEWQGEVMTLMERSQLLVASVGTSKWIKWELAESLRRGFENKSLFIFPLTMHRGRRAKQKQAAQHEERINTLKALYSPSESPDYKTLRPKEFLLVQVGAQAQTILLTTHKPGSNSLVLAVVIGHYLLQQVP